MARTLSDAHRHELVELSGIPEALIEQRGYYTATTKSELKAIGYPESQQLAPALVIPMHGVDRELVGYQIKPDNPRVRDGKVIKYETPRGWKMRLDIHPAAQAWLADKQVPLWITEGVKKGDCAVARGICCIALLGVWNWKSLVELSDWDRVHLKGRTVFLAFDSDSSTKREVRQALGRLAGMLDRRGATVRFVVPPSRDGRKVGLDDYLVAGGTIEALVRCAEHELPGLEPATIGHEPKTYPFTEAGNAERLIDAHGEDLRYCATLRRWLTWDGKRWLVDETEGAPIYQKALAVVRDMYEQAGSLRDDEARKELAKWAIKSENARPIENMIRLASKLPGVAVTVDELDRNHHLLNVGNGTLNLDTFEMREHCREDLLTRVIHTPYDEGADCPRWVDFLTTVLQDDKPLMRYVWKACGYSLTGLTSEKCFFFLHGAQGDNGKSVFVNVLMSMLGEYASSTPTSTLLAKNGEGSIPNDLARLKGVRLVAASEAGENKRLDEELIKQLTGNDTISARFMRAEWFDYRPTYKIWMTGNYKPIIRGQDKAIWNRVRLIPFLYSVPKEKQVRDLDRVLMAEEAAGILAWMIDGYRQYKVEGLGSPSSVAKAVDEYREEMDDLGEFLRQCTTQVPGSSVGALRLYEAYERWCKVNGMHAMTSTSFGRRLGARGIEKRKTMTGAVYRDIGLQDDERLENVYRGGE